MVALLMKTNVFLLKKLLLLLGFFNFTLKIILFLFRVINRGQQPLIYSSDYGDSSSSTYVEFVQEFQREMAKAVGRF